VTYPPSPPPSFPLGGYAVPTGQGHPGYSGPPGHPGYPPLGPPLPTTPDGRALADFSQRLLARLVDMAVFFVIGLLLSVPAIGATFWIIGRAIDRSSYDSYGNVTSSPSPASIIGPIVAIYAGILVIALVAGYVYEVELTLRRNGTTWGKRVMKLQIVPLADDGFPVRPLTRGMLVKRFLSQHVLGVVIPFFNYIDGLWQLWDQPYRQCLHDKWAGTVVVRTDVAPGRPA
jgi:uncharacterized RDD family membrane protein YckC